MIPSFRLYVVELDESVRSSRRFRRENSAGSDACLYVGSTAHTPEHRFSQHKAGRFSNRGWVQKFGRWLRYDLMGSATYQSRESAEQAERELAETLRSQGYSVWSR